MMYRLGRVNQRTPRHIGRPTKFHKHGTEMIRMDRTRNVGYSPYLRASFVPNLVSPRFAFIADAEDTLVAPGRCTNPQHDGMRRRARLAT